VTGWEERGGEVVDVGGRMEYIRVFGMIYGCRLNIIDLVSLHLMTLIDDWNSVMAGKSVATYCEDPLSNVPALF
jgi:hypothetical protein